MKFLLKIFCVSFLLVNSSAFAFVTGSWTEVKDIYIAPEGSIFITLNSLPGCYAEQGAYLTSSGSNVDKTYSTILAAFMAKKKIRPYYDINEGRTGWSMCTITAIAITH